MFAYCNNNPIVLTDSEGQCGIVATMLLGTAVGVISQYVCDIVDNMMSGKTGLDILVPSGSLGEYVASGLSGAVCAIPGAGTIVSVVCDLATPALAQGVDAVVSGSQWSWAKYGEDVATNLTSSCISSAVSVKVPEYIRDVKPDIKNPTIKGTKKLTKHLNDVQTNAKITNNILGIAATATVQTGSNLYNISTGKFTYSGNPCPSQPWRYLWN